MSAQLETLPSGKLRLTCFNPATGEPLGELESHTLEEVDQALERLRQAAAAYNQSPVWQRVKLVRRFQKALTANLDRIVETICAETGKKPPEGLLEFFSAAELGRYAAREAPAALHRQYRPSGVLIHKRGYVDYRPHGVAVVIAPWNYPYVLLVAPVIEALLAGNTVVVKPSEHTSLTALLVKEIFDEATGRPELFEVVLGAGEVGQRLVTSLLTDLVCFTGSTGVGRKVAKACAEQLKPYILELGGKDPLIVLADADLKQAAKAAVWGGFTNAGQSCIAVERVYVEQPVYEQFLDLVRLESRKLRVGPDDNHQIGAVSITAQYDKIQAHIKDATDRGANVERLGSMDGQEGRFVAPALLTEVDHTMKIMSDETFGPTLAVMPVASAAEAVQKANDSSFGLSAYIFTGNPRRGRELARQLECGSACINDVLVQAAQASLPYGGFRDSGIGKLHGREGLLAFSRQQAVVEPRINLPVQLWWYDLVSKTYGLMKKFIRAWYR